VRKNAFIRAKVSMSEEPGGTLFHVRGQGMPIPGLFATMMLVNNRGIAKQITDAIGAREEFRDNVSAHRVAEVTCEQPMQILGVLAPWALERGHPLADISVHRPTLEEIYLRLTAEAK
jgi:hypothetical protein